MADDPSIEDSILESVKSALGAEDSFDPDIKMHINSVLSTLWQLGVGPPDGYMVTDDSSKWEDFLGTTLLQNHVKSYVTLRVRMLFDPPTLSFLLTAFNEQIKEFEWRIKETREYMIDLPLETTG